MLLEDYDWTDDHRKNVEFAYAFIRERVAKGGKSWRGYPMSEKPVMHGLWRDNPATPEGKYLVKRRDGTVVEWPNFTIGARDPAAPAALRAYADAAEALGMTVGYANSVRRLADEFELYRAAHGDGDPDRGRHREDDPRTVNEMRQGRSV
jgi:hypothetical protein